MKKDISKNVAMVAYTYYISDPRVKKEAEALAENGYCVDFYCLKKSGEKSFQQINRVNVYRSSCQHYRGKSNIKYLFSYMVFFLQIFFKLTFMFFRKRYRLIHINNMPDLLVFTAIVPRIFGSKIILDIHDVMSDVFFNRGDRKEKKAIKKILIFQEYISSRFSNLVITVDDYCKKIINIHGTSLDKISVVSNFPDEDLFKPITIEKKEENLFKLIFHGTISKIYGLGTVIEGINKVKNKIPGLRFKILGEGDQEDNVFNLIREYDLENIIEFKNKKVPIERIPDEIKDYDLGIVSYSCLNTIFSNKFLEYISMGIPTLISYNDEIYNYFGKYNLEFYNRNDPDSFAEKLYYLYSDRDRCNQLKDTTKRLAKKFRWSTEKKKYLELVEKLLN